MFHCLLLKNGCFNASFAVILFLGSKAINLLKRSNASAVAYGNAC